MPKDFLDEIIAERTAKTPQFPALVEAALSRRKMIRRLAEDRMRMGLSQTDVAGDMETSQSAVARIESGRADVKLSTLERYAASLGRKVEWRAVPSGASAAGRSRGSSAATAKKSIARRSAK